MTDQAQTFKIKCPHCGWKRNITININAGLAEVTAGPSEVVRDMTEKIRKLFKDKEMEEAYAWIVMRACPNPPCGKTYEVKLRTGEVRK